MKSLIDYIKECDFATPMNTIGMGNPSGPDINNIGSEPIITGKPRKLKKVKKKSVNESNINLSELLKNIIYDDDFYENNYSIFTDDATDEQLRIKLIDGYCIEVCMFVSDYYNVKNIQYYLLDDKGKDYHCLMRYNGLWYDAYNYNGVDKLEDLKFIEINKSYHKYDEGELHNHLHLISKNEFDFDKAQKLIH